MLPLRPSLTFGRRLFVWLLDHMLGTPTPPPPPCFVGCTRHTGVCVCACALLSINRSHPGRHTSCLGFIWRKADKPTFWWILWNAFSIQFIHLRHLHANLAAGGGGMCTGSGSGEGRTPSAFPFVFNLIWLSPSRCINIRLFHLPSQTRSDTLALFENKNEKCLPSWLSRPRKKNRFYIFVELVVVVHACQLPLSTQTSRALLMDPWHHDHKGTCICIYLVSIWNLYILANNSNKYAVLLQRKQMPNLLSF